MKNLLDLSMNEAVLLMKEMDQPSYRAKQILEFVWKRGARSFEEMTNLPVSLRRELGECFEFAPNTTRKRFIGKGGVVRFLIDLPDGASTEAVLLPSRRGATGCISSMSGCPLGCLFCATGTIGFARNLTSGEMLDSIDLLSSEMPLANLVFMGMGEPLLNLDNLSRAIEILTDPELKGISRRRITVSTAGIPEGILSLIEAGRGVRLAISLGAADDETRSQLMPKAAYPITEILSAAERYRKARRARVTIEYILLDGINDRPSDARRLSAILSGFPFRVNLIPYNPVPGLPYRVSRRAEAFRSIIEGKVYGVTIRRSLGNDIAAACGRLALLSGDSASRDTALKWTLRRN